MKKTWFRILLTGMITLTFFGLAQTAGAAGKGYTPGLEGVLAASVPPPGVHWRMFNMYYEADTLTDAQGDKIGNGFDLGVLVQVHRVIHMTGRKILGADYGYSVILPMVATDFEVTGFSDSRVGLGDLYVEPLILAWHEARYDVALGLGVNLPTGHFDAAEPASPGNGYWSAMLTLGATMFFDDQKSLSASVLTRTIYYGEQDDTDKEPGSEFIMDFGVGKEMPLSKGLLIRPGICGYSLWQITGDDGPGTSDDKHSVYALGAEVNLFWLPPALFQANLRTLFEFGAEGESEGTKTVLTITKSF
jgi:hypothetical protein